MALTKNRVFVPNVFQYEALQKIDASIQNSERRGIIVMPTGTGKTFLAALLTKRLLLENLNRRFLFICHNNDILMQANEKEFKVLLSELWISFGYYNAKEKNISTVTFATTKSLSMNLHKFDKKTFDYVFVDEAHHYQAKSFKKVLEFFEARYVLGLTATPYRTDGISLFSVLGNILYHAKTADAIKKGLLTKINYYCVDHDIDFTDVRWTGTGYDVDDINRKICVKEYDDAIIKEYRDTVVNKFNKKKAICFCATVEHAERMAKVFSEEGIRAIAHVSKHIPKNVANVQKKKDPRITVSRKTREEIVQGFRDGEYDVIFVRDYFNEGIDVPDADCIIMLRPTESHIIFTQQLGRGLRKKDGKEDVLVLDFIGNAKRCLINYEVLNEMMDLNILQEAEKIRNVENDYNKEIIVVRNGNKVRLTKKKFDYLKSIKKMRYNPYTREEIVSIYNRVKTDLGHPPNVQELAKFGKGLNHQTVCHVMKTRTWAEFRELMGDEYKISKETIAKEWRQFYKEHNKWPTCRDLKKYRMITDNTIRNRFRSLQECLQYCSDGKEKGRIAHHTEESIMRGYNARKRQLSKIPLDKDFNDPNFVAEYGSITAGIRTVYNDMSYLDFLKKIGDYDEYAKQNPKVCRDISKDYVKNKFIEETNAGARSFNDYSGSVKYGITKFYDGIYAIRKDVNIGFSPIKKKITLLTKIEIEKRFVDFINEHNYIPRLNELVATHEGDINIVKHAVSKHWGGYRKFLLLKYDGKIPKCGKIIEKPCKIVVDKRSTIDKQIKQYFLLKEALGRQPTSTELRAFKPCYEKALQECGGFHKFLERIGEPFSETGASQRITKETMIKRFKFLVTKLQRVPKLYEVSFCASLKREWGSYLNFLKEQGYKIEDCYTGNYLKRYLPWTKERCVDEWRRLEKLLGRVPVRNDFCYKNHPAKISEKIIYNIFGRFSGFEKYMGVHRDSEQYLQGLRDLYFKCKNTLGRSPTVYEVRKYTGIGHKRFIQCFKAENWNHCRQIIGDPVIVITDVDTKQQIRNNYFRIKKKIAGRYVSTKDYVKHTELGNKIGLGMIHKLFVTYDNFLKWMGEKTYSNKDRTRESVLKEYKSFSKKHKHEISFKKFWKETGIHQQIIEKLFGSWNGLVIAGDDTPNKRAFYKYFAIKDVHNVYDRAKLALGGKVPRLKDLKELGLLNDHTVVTMLKKQGLSWRDIIKQHGDSSAYKKRMKNMSIKNLVDSGILKTKNLQIIDSYKPVVELSKRNLTKSKDGSMIVGNKWKHSEYTDVRKVEQRVVATSQVVNDLPAVVLDSKDCLFVKELIKQGKHPSVLYLPNCYEFTEMINTLKFMDLPFKVVAVNTAVSQFLADTEEKFAFVWLDYCGAFSFYANDLDIVFAKHLNEMTLIVTYSTFDPQKSDTTYYYTKVVNHILKKVNESKIYQMTMIEEISKPYKKNMYTVGVHITPILAH